jgi:hypothetical protein
VAILARRLRQGALGQYAYTLRLVDISFLVCLLGVTGAISRFAVEYSHASPLLSGPFRRVVATGDWSLSSNRARRLAWGLGQGQNQLLSSRP